MAKPTDLPEWATDANYSAGAEPEAGSPTKVAPISSKKASGWRPEEKPKAQSLNWWQNLVYQWVTWLDAGVWEAVSLTLSGDLDVANVIASGDVTATGTVEGAGLYYTDVVPILLPGARHVSTIHSPLLSGSGHHIGLLMIANTSPYTIPIDGLVPGDIITAWSVVMDKVSGGTGAYTGVLKSYNSATMAEADESPGTGIQTFGGASGPGTVLGETGLNIAVVDGISAAKQYYIEVDPSGSCTNDAHVQAYVWVKRPVP